MEHIKELVNIINKRKLSQIDAFDKSLLSKKDTLFSKLYNGIAEGKISSDEEAVHYLYGNKEDSINYRKLKSRFKNRLFNTLYFIDINNTEINSSKRAYFDCMNRLYLSNILLRYAENRSASIQLILDNYSIAKKYNFFDILKEYSYKLLVFYGMTGEEKKYNQEYVAYLEYIKEYELEQKVQLIYTKVFLVVHYNKKTQEQKEIVIKQYADEVKEISKESKSLVIYFIYIRTLLFYYEILGKNNKINETCDLYLKQNSNYYSSILSENYLNTIYIYKLKSLFELRDYNEALLLIDNIISSSKGVSYLAVKEFKIKIFLNNLRITDAKSIIHNVQLNSQYKHANSALRERWIIYTAYTEFLENYKNDGNYKFSLSKFTNEILMTAQDKAGFNLAARILSILFYIGRNDLDNAMQHIESLKAYQTRYLKDNINIRSNLFIKLLSTMEKKSFNYKNLGDLKEYLLLKENYKNQILNESEIIFYDKLWEILLDILKSNDQKLIVKIR